MKRDIQEWPCRRCVRGRDQACKSTERLWGFNRRGLWVQRHYSCLGHPILPEVIAWRWITARTRRLVCRLVHKSHNAN
jgi:hypothetical protein